MKLLPSFAYGILLGPLCFMAWMWASLPLIYVLELSALDFVFLDLLVVFLAPAVCFLFLILRWKSLSSSKKTFFLTLFLSATTFWYYVANIANTTEPAFVPIEQLQSPNITPQQSSPSTEQNH